MSRPSGTGTRRTSRAPARTARGRRLFVGASLLSATAAGWLTLSGDLSRFIDRSPELASSIETGGMSSGGSAGPVTRAAWDETQFRNLSTAERVALIDRIIAQRIASATASAPVAAAPKADREHAAPAAVDKTVSPAEVVAELITTEVPAPVRPQRDAAQEAAAADALRAILQARVDQANRLQDLAALSVPDAPAQTEVAAADPLDMQQEDVAATDPTGSEETRPSPVTDLMAGLLPNIVPIPDRRPQVPASALVARVEQEAPAQATASGRTTGKKPGSAMLAYAPAGVTPDEDDDTSVFSGLKKVFKSPGSATALPSRASGVAVYDISTATVHMPDGSELVAHSGIGKMMDDPRYVDRKNSGPTPPNVYSLRMRESLFHGVEAIRMTPKDPGAMYGRDGMLTHTNLLRGRLGSHGCVAFVEYSKFLKAFKTGAVKTLIVVPTMNELPTYMAML
ncbi:tlde1 domain-containing protein [Roseibium aestuarii]|uniref:Tlde1 domain-containing protein n=1 Tax=Roseibium aestuarii TaxID=2600299 RepID=A0ABW4JX20_9HYPH|nr:tlde1 domain-containing protein [Roseibium aestuarii]